MEIKRQSREFSKREMYNFVEAPGNNSVKDLEGETIEVTDWMIYEDVNMKGEQVEILAMLTADNDIVTTLSATFKKYFLTIIDKYLDPGDKITIEISKGRSKAGREFVYCKLV